MLTSLDEVPACSEATAFFADFFLVALVSSADHPVTLTSTSDVASARLTMDLLELFILTSKNVTLIDLNPDLR